MENTLPKIFSLVIPCYNNEKNIPELETEILRFYEKIKSEFRFELIVVDDFSSDKSFQLLRAWHQIAPYPVRLIRLIFNEGSHTAAYVGMKHAEGDVVAFMAADLQMNIDTLLQMLDKWKNGARLVLASRRTRQDSFMSKLMSNLFHWFIKQFVFKSAPQYGFDTVLFEKSLAEPLYGIKPQLTHFLYEFLYISPQFEEVAYDRLKRRKGKSQWTSTKKITLFMNTLVRFGILSVPKLKQVWLFVTSFLFIFSFIFVRLVEGSLFSFIFGIYLNICTLICFLSIIPVFRYDAYYLREFNRKSFFVIEDKIGF
ncbi:MAG: glycosyltransferase [Cytophagales bacterium]|nr:MAG: glycosyltransferase [Cytophagales bacterium]TAF62113.1 MAG: glycosyltransferase [Cytophagales bacterium]